MPEQEIEVEEGLVSCLMVLLNKETGLTALEDSTNLWTVIAVSVVPKAPPRWPGRLS